MPRKHTHAPALARRAPGGFILWISVLGAPVLWSAQLLTMYALVPWVCTHGHMYLLYIVAAGYLLAAAGCALLGYLAFSKSAAGSVSSEAGDVMTRSRFMAGLGLLITLLFSVMIVAQAIPPFFIGPCLR